MVHEIRSTDPGAAVLSGQVGTLLNVIDETAILGRCFTTADDVAFTDRSAEARLDGGAPFVLFPTPATGDRAYFGCSVKFNRLDFDLATLGVGGAYAYEYRRNDASWQALAVTDGTSGFTQDGAVTFTMPGDAATVSVNGVTMWYFRIRPTSAPSTNPTVNSVSAFGWLRAFEGTNKAVYRSLTGARLYYRVQDNAPGAGGAREARLRGYETMSDVDTGTGDFPTVAQLSAGIIPRKSATLDATARAWRVVADHRTVYVYITTGDGYLSGFKFGEFFSFVTGDISNGMVRGRIVENSAISTNETLDSIRNGLGGANVIPGTYVARAYTGLGASLNVGVHVDYVKGSAGGVILGIGSVQYPNGADGGLYLAPVWIHEVTTVRGLMRGFWSFCHSLANVQDLDTAPGAGDLAGKTFVFYKNTGNSGLYSMETTNTWRTN